MGLGVFDRATLKAVGRKEDRLLGPSSALSVGQNLNIFSFDWADMVFALDEDEEIDAERPEPSRRIDLVSSVGCLQQLAMLDIEPFKRIAGLSQEVDDKALKLASVEPSSMIR